MKRSAGLLGALWMAFGAAGALGAEPDTDNIMVRRAFHVCAACHGEGGDSKIAVYPKLAGQQPAYVVAQLKAFRDQKRFETDTQAYMWGISALLDDAAIQGLADYYAAQPPAPGKVGNAALVKQGKKIYHEGIAAKGVRPCASCHGEDAEGAAVFPRLSGQHADYVANQLKVFRTKLRPHGIVMTGQTKALSPAEIQAVAHYVQSR
jgi:cytochrome c553